MYYQGPGFVGFHMLWVLPLVLLLVAGVAVLAVWAIRESARPQPVGPPRMPMDQMSTQAPRETPLEILARRFASGEITADEYQKARDLLGGGPKT
jgi:uncharacterized membrane protein